MVSAAETSPFSGLRELKQTKQQRQRERQIKKKPVFPIDDISLL